MTHIFTPVNQVRFTNVAIVRLKRGGKRFEIACYKSKVGEWKKGTEKDLDEVLQTSSIFTNTSKGIVARKQDLKKCFKTTNETEIIKRILKDGQVQVSGDERKKELEVLAKDIATIIAEKCVDPKTKRALTVGMIEKAMRDIHYSVNTSDSAKKQALLAIKALEKENYPIMRANMRIKVCLPVASLTIASDPDQTPTEILLEKHFKSVFVLVEEKLATDEEITFTTQIAPSSYREIVKIVKTVSGTKGRLEVVTAAVVDQGNVKIT